jgi:sugar/nucleoside kinase (ribokinase family)
MILFPNEALVDISIQIKPEFLGVAKSIYGEHMHAKGWNETSYDIIQQIVQNANQNVLTSSGGVSSNTAKAIKKLNENTVCRIWSVAGNDTYGQVYRSAMVTNGVDPKLRMVPGGHTGVCLCLVTPDGERTMFTDLGVSKLFDGMMVIDNPDMFSGATITHLEGFTIQKPGFIQACITLAKQENSLVSLDLCDPGLVTRCKADFNEVVTENVDILFGNMATMKAFTGLEEPFAMLEALKDHKLVAITDSANGCYIKGPTGIAVHVPAHPATVIDTSAAGDYFIAGLLNAASQRGIPDSPEALTYFGNTANIVAAAMCEHQGTDLPQEAWNVVLDKLSLLSPVEKAA